MLQSSVTLPAVEIAPTFCVLSSKVPGERAVWMSLWESWPQREIFAHPDYVGLFSANGVEPLCACWTGGEGSAKVLYPFLLRPLDRELFGTRAGGWASDIASAYGYGGAFCWGGDSAARSRHPFWEHFDAWARNNRVVSEFVRFCLFPEHLLPYPGRRRIDRQNVVRDLTGDEEAIFRDLKPNVRKNVRAAQRRGVEIVVDPHGERLGDFLEIYRHTMDRRCAADEYYFPVEFFHAIQARLRGQFAYFHAVHNGRIVSTELVLLSAENAYSYLGGTRDDAFGLRPSDLLKFEVIRWAKAEGKKRFVLGGGYRPDDGIFRFKAGFSPRGLVPFQVGQRILDPQMYDALLAARRDSADRRGEAWCPRSDFFPAYRS